MWNTTPQARCIGRFYELTLVLLFILISVPGVFTAITIRTVLPPYNCSPALPQDECRWSNWSRTCFWPRNDYTTQVGDFVEEISGHGCQVKKDSAIMKPSYYLEYLFSKAPEFLQQSMDAFQCTGGVFSEACVVDGLTQEEIEDNQRRHPDWPHLSGDACDFNQLVPLHRVKGNDGTSRLWTRLMCSFYGTSQPVITCTRLSNFRCQCCCSGFVPTNDGYCVTDPNSTTDPVCKRDETDSPSCLRRDRKL